MSVKLNSVDKIFVSVEFDKIKNPTTTNKFTDIYNRFNEIKNEIIKGDIEINYLKGLLDHHSIVIKDFLHKTDRNL